MTVDIMDTDADVLKTVKAGAMPSIEHRARDSSSRLTIGNSRVRSAVVYVAVAVGLVVATAILRGQAISDWGLLLNADEAQLMADGRAALLSPVPFSTWLTGTLGPYLALFLAGLGALGAPLTLAFAHLLSAVLWALIASARFVAASWAIGRGPALVVTVVCWFPIATTWLVGFPSDFSVLCTEYLPMLLVAASALVPRAQLAARPWLFSVVGVLAGVAVGAKYQVAPLAVAFVAAQLIVLAPSAKRTLVSVLWWLGGAVLPVVAVVLVMLASPRTTWTLVEQNYSFLVSYMGNKSQLVVGSADGRVETTFATLTSPGDVWPQYHDVRTGYYLLVVLAGLIWLCWHSERRSNVARVVLIVGGLTAMLGGGTGAPHYLILLFGAAGLAATMPVKPGARLFPRRLSPTVLAGALATAVAVALVLVFGHVIDRMRLIVPLSPHAAAAALSPDSVNRIPALTRACPPRSKAMVWGYAAELYIAQDWQSTSPYMGGVGILAVEGSANRETGESVIRAAINRADCIVDATLIKSPVCPGERSEVVSWCLSAKFSLPRFYPQLVPLIGRQFHTVPVTGGCEGCTVYVRNVSS